MFYQSVHRHLPEALYRMKLWNAYISGPPDCWYSGRQNDLWAEYKFMTLPKRDTTAINPGLSEKQLEWINSRHGEGRNVAVILGCTLGGAVLKNGEWNQSWFCCQIRERLQTRKQIAEWIEHTCCGSAN